ncbi:MAG: hypothetical protein A3K19_18785 [Lentisphaerae bacterium RIFOXYB12_FULL_65_16]|nr:MAG: hypothetical protein A3K18_26235 [Lentisphaerae bacterium RIFOXYA12_64_32]OGV92470.1 MAG: hypothetical protein A3K19_18785 [Lentisphaerae bacterium RIFOXYB12_FULL_65_16]
MKTLQSSDVREALRQALLRMNVVLPEDVRRALRDAAARETGPARAVLQRILDNVEIAERRCLPMCQDTGMVVTFVELGQDVRVEGEGLPALIDGAIADAYQDGYFRKSVVVDPLKDRKNTGTNLPAVVYWDVVTGDGLVISCLAKGFGSENYSRAYMLKPTEGRGAVIGAVVKAMREAGGNPCPPVILGVGIGGTMDWAARLSKQALLRELDDQHPDPYYAALERDILETVNGTGIGAGGLGGLTTALGVKIATYPTHIAGLPVAVSVNCWADRRAVVRF